VSGPRLSAAVLAGGSSTRMGRDKALIEVDGRPLALHVADRLRACSDDVFVVAKRDLGFPVVIDRFDVDTPLAGVATALRAATHRLVFVCGCDMPLVDPDLIRDLAARAEEHLAVVPQSDGKLQSLHAVWSVDALPDVEACLLAGERSVRAVLERVGALTVEVEGASFRNINTPEELELFRSE
jgi:molybdenum cofactor guanylyltransferase